MNNDTALGLQWLLLFNGGLLAIRLVQIGVNRLSASNHRNVSTRPGWRVSL